MGKKTTRNSKAHFPSKKMKKMDETKPMGDDVTEDSTSNYSEYDNESVCSGLERAKELQISTSTTPPEIISAPKSDDERSASTRRQLEIYDRLLKSRMKLQPLLKSVNSLPRGELFQQLRGECGISEKIEAVKTDLEHVYQVSKNITSALNVLLPREDGVCSESCGDFLEKAQEMMQQARPAILQDWFDKTRLSVAKIPKKDFSNFEKSPVVQIAQIMTDPSRLVRKTQMNRSNVSVVGKERNMSVNYADELKKEGILYDFDPEIFDDSDFYQRQLSDFIKLKSDGSLDFMDANLSKNDYKMNRPVDLRATKARKIRYTVIRKLAGFCVPTDESTWVDEAMDELFGSVFGGNL